MFDLIKLRALLDDFLDQAPKLSSGELAHAYLSLDQTLNVTERKNQFQAHNLNIMKNIAYEASPSIIGEANACIAQDFFVRLRDAGGSLFNYRKSMVMLRDFYIEAAALLNSRGECGLATDALKHASRFGSTIDKTFLATETIYPGWFERHVRLDGGDILAIDYVKGSLAVLQSSVATKQQVRALDIGVDKPIEDIIKTKKGWYFFTEKGTQVVETTKNFDLLRVHELKLPPASISRHFAHSNSCFACTQFNDTVYLLDDQFLVMDKISIAGAEELRKPVFLDDMLYVFNFSRGNTGNSELLAIGPGKRVRCVYDGLDNPMSMIIRGKTIAVGDSIGIHVFEALHPHKVQHIYFSDIVSDAKKGPYCNGLEFTEECIVAYILYLEDFALQQDINQHVLSIQGKFNP